MQKLCTQNGRSMIEMLGVLAIIGVLSVGGLAGYSKAMKAYRIDKALSDVTMMVTNIKMAYQSQRDYSGISARLALNAKMLPKSVTATQETSGNVILSNQFGGKVNIMAGDLAKANDNRAFVLIYNGLPREACVKLVSAEWNTSTGLVALQARNTSTAADLASPAIRNAAAAYEGCAGTIDEGNIIACSHGTTLKSPPPVANANIGCKCPNANTCSVAWKFQ